MGRILIIAGVVLTGIGLVFWLLGRVGFKGLPGDIRYESEHARFYFPIVTSIVLSILLTGLFWLIAFFRNWWNR
jgi:hypothetical protein